MEFKGSLVIKRTHLINLISDQKAAFRSRISKDAKHIVWGQEIAYNTLLEEDFSRYDWDAGAKFQKVATKTEATE